MNRQQTDFNLTHFFIVTSAVIILLVVVAVSIIFSQLTRQQMIKESQDDAISVATQIEKEISVLFTELLMGKPYTETIILQAQLQARLTDYHDLWDVILVRLYDRQGNPVFSDEDKRFDFSIQDADGLDRALAGEVWSEFESHRGDLDQSLPAQVVETYVPVYDADGRQIIGVLEVYRDVVADYERAARVQVSAILSVTLAFGILFVILSLIVRRGDLLLNEANMRFGNVLSATTDAIICTDREGHVTMWNNAATQMLGYTPDEMLGQSYSRLVLPEARPRTRFPSLSMNGSRLLQRSPIVSTAVHHNGSIIPVEINVSTYRQGENIEYAAVVRDITQRRQAEIEINHHVEKLTVLSSAAAAINKSSSLGGMLEAALLEIEMGLGLPYSEVWLLDRETKVLRPHLHYGFPDDFASKAAGFVADEDVPDLVAEMGQPLIIQDLATDSHFEPDQQHDLQVALGVPLMTQEELVGVIIFFSDSAHYFTPSVISCLSTVGKLIGTAVERIWLYDNSVRQAAELEELNDALRDHAGRLEERVADRTAALEVALEKAQESDRLKSEFVSNVNHELRTPLSSIKLSLDLFTHLSEEKQARYLEMMRRETLRLERLIEDLLDISRLDLDKVQPQMQMVDMNELLGTIVEDRQPLIESRGLTLEVDWAKKLPSLWGDPSLLNQVITNLLTNAMNYTPPGGQITLTTSLRTADDQSWVTFSVTDTGPGIDPADLPHLFERFYRGQVGKSARAPGTGLGLAICNEILQLHEGRIEVQTQPGRGATFSVWLRPAWEFFLEHEPWAAIHEESVAVELLVNG